MTALPSRAPTSSARWASERCSCSSTRWRDTANVASEPATSTASTSSDRGRNLARAALHRAAADTGAHSRGDRWVAGRVVISLGRSRDLGEHGLTGHRADRAVLASSDPSRARGRLRACQAAPVGEARRGARNPPAGRPQPPAGPRKGAPHAWHARTPDPGPVRLLDAGHRPALRQAALLLPRHRGDGLRLRDRRRRGRRHRARGPGHRPLAGDRPAHLHQLPLLDPRRLHRGDPRRELPLGGRAGHLLRQPAGHQRGRPDRRPRALRLPQAVRRGRVGEGARDHLAPTPSARRASASAPASCARATSSPPRTSPARRW